MMRCSRISRRRLGQLLAATLQTLPGSGWAQSLDQGIGGTGVVGDDSKEEPSDQMIGGTGVIGTIRRFGSIYVNGLRIAFAPTLPIQLLGAAVSAEHLRLGHVVRVKTAVGAGPLAARSIAVAHEVVGPIDALGSDRMTVLGQTVLLDPAVPSPALLVGQHVAVSGLRRLDGSILASLVEAAVGRPYSVAGPLTRASDGILRVGALDVVNADPGLAGQRVFLRGRMAGRNLLVTRAVTEKADLARTGASRFSIEAFVGRAGTGLRLGSGLQLDSDVSPPAADEPVVLIVVLAKRQQLVAQKIESLATIAPTIRQPRDTERGTRDKGDRGNADGSRHGSDRGSGSPGGSRGHR